MSVVAVSISQEHLFSKEVVESITLMKDLGVEGDCHLGETVQHRSRMKIVPKPANLRQVHLVSLETLQVRDLVPGDIGENITVEGLDLLSLSTGTRLKFVPNDGGWSERHEKPPTIVLTGVRNPCPQIEKFRPGLQETFIVRDGDRNIIKRLAGVMSIVEVGGIVKRGMKVVVEQSLGHSPLLPV